MQYSKFCYVSTIAWPLRVYIGPHIDEVTKNNYVMLIADGVEELSCKFSPSIMLKNIEIKRKVSIYYDCLALFRLYFAFKRNKFDCVHSIMPKAGLLSMVAAKLAGVPVRIHTFTGQIWQTRTGLSRLLFMLLDRLLAKCATSLLTDSKSQMEFLVKSGIVGLDKIKVLNHGSIAGVNLVKFSKNSDDRVESRKRMGISINDVLYLYVGRFNYEKGVSELLLAFKELALKNSDVRLLMIGSDEGDYSKQISRYPYFLRNRITIVDFTYEPEEYMCAADVLCLPSHREGFGNVILEAAALGIPAIASNISGLEDSVVDGITGILHRPGNVGSLLNAMELLLKNIELRIYLGLNAQRRVKREFDQRALISHHIDYYQSFGLVV